MTTTILTPNRRLAYTLPQPAISLNDFLLSQRSNSDPTVLSTAHESWLWQQVIAQLSPNPLLNVIEAAKLAKQAWDALQLWQIPLNTLASDADEQVHTFIKWANLFRDTCTNQWMTGSMLPHYFLNRPLELNNKDYLAMGFQQPAPAIRSLLTDYQISIKNNRHPTGGTCVQGVYDSPEQELTELAYKMRDAFEKDQSFLCVIPNLSERRTDLEYILWHTLDTQVPYNISLGKTLSEHSLLQWTWTTLDFLHNPLPLETCISWIRSPLVSDCFGESGELEWALCQLLEPHITLPQLKTLALQYHPRLSDALQKLRQSLPTCPKQSTSDHWVNYFSTALSAFNYTEKIEASDPIFLKHWHQLLSDFSSFSLLTTAFSFEQAINELKRQADLLTYQKAYQSHRIQIMGLLEAQDMISDETWVLGCQESKFPPRHMPNPFLPLPLIQTHQMPNASAEKEQAYFRMLLDNLIHHTKHIRFCYATHDNGQQFRASSLIKHHTQDAQIYLSTPLFTQAALETIIDNKAPEIQKNTLVRGGTNVLKYQSLCPFKAFAETRLKAYAHPALSLGLQSFERGFLLHNALDKLWQRIQTKSNLLRMDELEINALVSEIAHSVVITFSRKHPKLFSQTFCRIEESRIKKRLLQALAVDRERPDFQVLAQEKTEVVRFGHLQFTTRLDRIDQLADGYLLLIDYKTGLTRVQSWLDERPIEPQLPFYAISSSYPVSGIAYFEINSKNQQYKGIGETGLGITGIHPTKQYQYDNWQALLSSWQLGLNQLAIDYRLGIATVDPKDPSITCQFCQLQTLCRV